MQPSGPPADVALLLARLVAGSPWTESQSRDAFTALLSGALDQAQIGAMLALLQARGPTVDELAGAARVMREHVVPVRTPAGATVIDTCGTGGAPKTFNISTAAAIVAAAAGAAHSPRTVVAKHGNRSRTGRGSAEVLMALGVQVDASTHVQARCLEQAGVCFCFAIHHHPAMKHASAPRRSLGFPTVFNLLGPLTNPAGASRQLIGVAQPAHVELVASTLHRLGAARAIVAHSLDGLDELSTTADVRLAHVSPAGVQIATLDARTLGLPRAALGDLACSSVEQSAEFVRAVLAGTPGPRRDIVLLNAAAALLVSGACPSFEDGLAQAARAVDSGAAARTLAALAACSHGSA